MSKISQETLKKLNAKEVKTFNSYSFLKNIPVYKIEVEKDINIYISQLDLDNGNILEDKVDVLFRDLKNGYKHYCTKFSIKFFNTFNKVEDITRFIEL